MRKFLIGLALVAVVLVAVVVAVPFLVPVEQYKGRIEAEVAARTGREFRIQGPMALSLLPTLAVELNDVAFAGPPGARTPEMARLGKLELELKPWPLISGEIQIDKLVLRDPRIALEVDAQGRPNWALNQPAPANAPAETPPNAAPAPDGQQASGGGLPDLRFGEVQLINGQVSYFDARTQALQEVKNVDVTLRAPDLDQPADIKGRLVYRDRPVTVDTRVDQPRGLIETGASKLVATITGDLLTVKFDGALENGQAGPAARGALDLTAPALRDLATWATGNDPGELPVQSASVAGGLEASASRIALTSGTYKAGDVEATGNVGVALGGARPKIAGALSVGRVNLDHYLNQPGGAAKPAAVPPSAQPTPAPAPAGSTDGGWSTTPIDLSALRTVDADLKLALAGVIVKGVDVGASDVAIALDAGRLKAVMGETALFDGTVSGQVNADAASAVPALGLDLRINGVQAEPVLTRFADFNRLSGTARAVASLKTTGASQKAMVEGLNGQGSVTFTDGAINGINLAAMVRNATAAFQGQPVGNEPQKTDFAELGGNFTVRNGVVANDDLRLLAPLLRLEGKGTVSLPPKTIDYRIQPRLVGTIQGQGSDRDVAGISVPVLVRGSLENPTFAPDLAGLAEEALRDPEAIRRQIEGLKGANRDEAIKGVIEGLTGGQNQTPGQGSSNPAQQLKSLFGR
jgi:AsmA protein